MRVLARSRFALAPLKLAGARAERDAEADFMADARLRVDGHDCQIDGNAPLDLPREPHRPNAPLRRPGKQVVAGYDPASVCVNGHAALPVAPLFGTAIASFHSVARARHGGNAGPRIGCTARHR